MNILRSNRGETIAETLISMMIVTLGMTMLAGALIASANVAKQAADYSFNNDVGQLLPNPTYVDVTVINETTGEEWNDTVPVHVVEVPVLDVPILEIQSGKESEDIMLYSYVLSENGG